MNTTTSRTHHQTACDGVRAVWLPGTPVARETFETPVQRSMDGIVFKGTMNDVATHLHRQDFKAMARKQQLAYAQDSLTSFIATMDGVRIRRTAVSLSA
jgi:hypothetical protein